ncbi:MAG: tetratricopeptide repeat protein [Chthoniobacterales bacterium]
MTIRTFPLLFLFPLYALAQSSPTNEPTVRRAQAITPLDPNTEQPAWMQRVEPANPGSTQANIRPLPDSTPYRPTTRPDVEAAETNIQNTAPTPQITPDITIRGEDSDIPKAIPVAPAVPFPVESPQEPPTPTPKQNQPLPTPEETPQETALATPAGSPLLQLADRYYSRKMYQQAIDQYQLFLRDTSYSATTEERQTALYRVGESYRHLELASPSRKAYEAVLDISNKGEIAGAAAYRLGEILMDQETNLSAAAQFELAAHEAASPEVRLSATFFAARTLEKSNEFQRALTYYQEAISSEISPNPYQTLALSAAARIAANLEKKDLAVSLYKQLAQNSDSPKSAAEALVLAAKILTEESKDAEARDLLTQAASKKVSPWSSLATLALLEMDYQKKDFTKLTEVPDSTLASLPPESHARALLLKANALRELDKTQDALNLYQRLLNEFPNQPAAKEAQFQHVLCLYKLDSPDFEEVARNYLRNTLDLMGKENSKQREQAKLLLAEHLFKQKKYAEAADAYSNITSAKLPAALRADTLYKQAWCLAQTNQPQKATIAFSEFIENFPDSPLMPKALAERALSHQKSNANAAAITDYQTVIDKYPDSPEREVAMLQQALLYGTMKQNQKMQDAFLALIKTYPDSAARAQAEFWIGWVYFENKEYKTAIEHLKEARKLNAEAYAARAGLRIILANYYLEDAEQTAAELTTNNPGNIPGEVYLWLATQFLNEGNYAQAETFFAPLLDGSIKGPAIPELPLQMARAQLAQKKYTEAAAAATRFLENSRNPRDRARALVVISQANLGAAQLDEADKNVQEALLLQPEGAINAEARLLSGKIAFAHKNFQEAAKIFSTVGILYDDPKITPEALQLAIRSYENLGQASKAAETKADLARRYPQNSAAN